jgi:hypothetical protein
LKVKPNSGRSLGTSRRRKNTRNENGNVIEKAESIFQQFTENYDHAKMFNVGEADFLPAD